jgi:hypothetical protein
MQDEDQLQDGDSKLGNMSHSEVKMWEEIEKKLCEDRDGWRGLVSKQSM